MTQTTFLLVSRRSITRGIITICMSLCSPKYSYNFKLMACEDNETQVCERPLAIYHSGISFGC
jgi:hypothetical protein